MALTTLGAVLAIPGMAKISTEFLTLSIGYMSQAIKTYLKQNIEQQTLTEFYSGDNQPNIVLKQVPVQSIANLWFDPTGYWGQAPNAFPSTTLMTQGTQYALVLDSGGVVSNRGLVRLIQGGGTGWWGWGGGYGNNWQGKLAGTQVPVWPICYGGIKVEYVAGYATVPADLQYACGMLVAYAVRNMPSGSPLASESLGAYSYSIVQQAAAGMVPEIGSIAQTLAFYRDPQW